MKEPGTNNGLQSDRFLNGVKLGLSTLMLLAVAGCSAESATNTTSTDAKSATQTIATEETAAQQEADAQQYVRFNGKEMVALTKELLSNISDQEIIDAVTKHDLQWLVVNFCNKGDQYRDNPENNQLTQDDEARAYEYVGMVAYADLEDDGKFCDVWYQLFSSEEALTRFKEDVALPLEQAYASGDYSDLLADAESYAASGQYDYVNNIRISALYQLIFRSKNPDPSVRDIIRSPYEAIDQAYIEGKNISSLTPRSAQS